MSPPASRRRSAGELDQAPGCLAELAVEVVQEPSDRGGIVGPGEPADGGRALLSAALTGGVHRLTVARARRVRPVGAARAGRRSWGRPAATHRRLEVRDAGVVAPPRRG